MTERPYLTPRECADALGVTAHYIRGEIADGMLSAEKIERPVREGCQRSHPIIRIYHEDWQAYVRKYWPRFYDKLFPPAA